MPGVNIYIDWLAQRAVAQPLTSNLSTDFPKFDRGPQLNTSLYFLDTVSYPWTPVTSVSEPNDEFLLTAHGLAIGDKVQFMSTGTLPGGVTAGITYYVDSTAFTADKFHICDAPNNGPRGLNSAGTGTISFQKIGDTLYHLTRYPAATIDVYLADRFPPAFGTWSINFNGKTTALLPAGATAAQVRSALEAISTVGVGNVIVRGDYVNDFQVEFVSAKGNAAQNLMTVNYAGLSPAGFCVPAHFQVGTASLNNIQIFTFNQFAVGEQTSWSEIVPTLTPAPSVVRVQAGTGSLPEIQEILWPSPPATGTFKLQKSGSDPTGPIKSDASNLVVELNAAYPAGAAFTMQPNSQGYDRYRFTWGVNGSQTLLTIAATNIQYYYGWTALFPLLTTPQLDAFFAGAQDPVMLAFRNGTQVLQWKLNKTGTPWYLAGAPGWLAPPPKLFIDGNFAAATPMGPPRYERPIPRDSRCVLVRQKYKQWRAFYQPAEIWSQPGGDETPIAAGNTLTTYTLLGPSIFGQQTYLVEETDLGGSGVMIYFERAFVTIPRHRAEPNSISKTFKKIVSGAIAAFSQTVLSVDYFDYYLSPLSVGNLNIIPDAVNYGSGILYVNGFPNGGDNWGNVLVSLDFHPWMGNIWELKRTYA